MPPFPRPNFTYNYQANSEINAVRHHRDNEPGRQIPRKRNNRLLLATWNIANLGVQQRRDRDYRLIAEMISWFDIVALQEVNDNLAGLRGIQAHLPNSWWTLFSDKAGNDERMAFLYDGNKVSELEKTGEIAVPPSQQRFIRLPGITRTFRGFDRNPYLGSFAAGNFEFLLVNVHLYFGGNTRANRERRALEAYAAARWADLRRDDQHAYVSDIIALGDFNMPRYQPGDLIYTALRRRGLERPQHSTRISSTIATDRDYDQIMFFPGETRDEFTGNTGIFDFDGAAFAHVWQNRTRAQFLAYTRYYLSDHRILWAEFRI